MQSLLLEMENSSYSDFLNFFNENQIKYNKLNDDQFEAIRSLVENGTFELTNVLNGALESRDFNQISTIIESIRREYFLELGGSELFKLLLKTALDFVKKQINKIEPGPPLK